MVCNKTISEDVIWNWMPHSPRPHIALCLPTPKSSEQFLATVSCGWACTVLCKSVLMMKGVVGVKRNTSTDGTSTFCSLAHHWLHLTIINHLFLEFELCYNSYPILFLALSNKSSKYLFCLKNKKKQSSKWFVTWHKINKLYR